MHGEERGPEEIRTALGRFATGVTVVTTAVDGRRLGFTANSFASVSIAPPLVSWNHRRAAYRVADFLAAEHFAIHVLSIDQQEISRQFAAPLGERFAGLPVDEGIGGVPLIGDCSATFECRKWATLEAGDHIIFVGEVLRYRHDDLPPLLFHGGSYSRLASAPCA
jgi:3-hydroxy-9,10-secoandrosta-1,3,5(10)-triene-9,17-dione monooxygenase reductase component